MDKQADHLLMMLQQGIAGLDFISLFALTNWLFTDEIQLLLHSGCQWITKHLGAPISQNSFGQQLETKQYKDCTYYLLQDLELARNFLSEVPYVGYWQNKDCDEPTCSPVLNLSHVPSIVWR